MQARREREDTGLHSIDAIIAQLQRDQHALTAEFNKLAIEAGVMIPEDGVDAASGEAE